MRQTRRFALFAALALLLLASQGRLQVSALPTGAPISACADLTQRHYGASLMDCGSLCPFSVSLVAIDGTPVAAGAAQTYRCGSEHTREERLEIVQTLIITGYALRLIARTREERFA